MVHSNQHLIGDEGHWRCGGGTLETLTQRLSLSDCFFDVQVSGAVGCFDDCDVGMGIFAHYDLSRVAHCVASGRRQALALSTCPTLMTSQYWERRSMVVMVVTFEWQSLLHGRCRCPPLPCVQWQGRTAGKTPFVGNAFPQCCGSTPYFPFAALECTRPAPG